MKCDLPSGVKSMSGKSGGVLYKTYHKLDGTTETRAYILPRKENGQYGYTRRTAVTEGEKQRRILFSQAAMFAGQVLADKTSSVYKAWHVKYELSKREFNGKKYATLRGFIMAVYFTEHHNEHL